MPSDERNRPEHYQVPPRFQQGPLTTALQLGPLAFLNGTWRGPGFNAIWRPHNAKSEPVGVATRRFLELNLTTDSFSFHIIPGVVPNRGVDPQPDLGLYGLHYLQRVSDADPKPSPHVHPHGYSTTAGQALHIEPGLFMRVPASSQPAGQTGGTLVNQDTIVRMGSIPHGTTVLMQGPNPGNKPKPASRQFRTSGLLRIIRESPQPRFRFIPWLPTARPPHLLRGQTRRPLASNRSHLPAPHIPFRRLKFRSTRWLQHCQHRLV
jgi:hypothetical protein